MSKARELLAQAASELGYAADAQVLRKGGGAFIQVSAALRAIEFALSDTRAERTAPDNRDGLKAARRAIERGS